MVAEFDRVFPVLGLLVGIRIEFTNSFKDSGLS